MDLHLAAHFASGDREALAEAAEAAEVLVLVLSWAAARARRPDRTKRLNFIVMAKRSSKQN